MDEMSVHDIQRDICSTLVLYRGVPVQATAITPNGKTLTVKRVMDDKEMKVPFSLNDVTALRGRIGMINGTAGCVYYMWRIPMRRMSIGITANNSRVEEIIGSDREEYRSIREFNHHGLDDAINNRYPSFEQAIKYAKSANGGCAFDKQFAVDNQRNIYYKDRGIVGTVKAGGSSIDDIKWRDSFEHLVILLENDYEKTVRTFRA